jgi:hypothetical protein
MDEWYTDDDRLLTELGAAVRAADDVPESFVAAGKAAFAWHNIDADLAQLVSDSSVDPAEAGLRSSEPAIVRTMTFASAELSIELDVQADGLRGLVVPEQAGTVQVRLSGGEAGPELAIDAVGWFVIRPVPAAPFRLSVRLADGSSALTSWISL